MQYEFLSKIYDAFMADVSYSEWAAYIDRLIKNVNPAAKKMGECACGTGNVTIELLRLGYKVTPSDISREMLEICREKLRLSGFIIPCVEQDMARLEYPSKQDAIVACCDGVNYLSREDAALFFSAAYKNLRSGGVLAFDVSTEYKLSTVLGMNTFADENVDGAYIWRNCYDEESRLLELDITVFERQGKLYSRTHETQVQTAFSCEELVAMLKDAGFCRTDVYKAFTTQPPSPEDERIQFVAQKD